MKKLILVLLVAIGASFAATAQHNQVHVTNNSIYDFCVQSTSWGKCINAGPSINSSLIHIPAGGTAIFQGDPVHLYTTQIFLIWDDNAGACSTSCAIPAQATMGPATGNTAITINHICNGGSVNVQWNSFSPCFDAMVDIN